jgi:hypothetical protein
MGTIRKKILKKNKEARRNSEGQPRVSSNKRLMRKMMKDFNAYVKRKMDIENIEALKAKVVTHEELGLPEEISGEDLMNFINNNKQQ